MIENVAAPDGGTAQVSAGALYADDEMEIFVDSTEGGASPEQQQLINDLKARQAELTAKVDPVEAMKTAIQGLGSQLAPREAAPDVNVRAQGVADWQAYKENFNTKVFEDPFQMVTDLVSKATEMQSASVANQNLAYSRRIVQIDPATAPYYKRWSDEVEREVAKMPVALRVSNPNVYEDALRIVKSNHIDELIDERIAGDRTKASTAQQPAARGYVETAGARPMATGQPAPRSQVRISDAKMRQVSAYAEEWGIPEEAAIRLFQKRGML
jgi:hypothetical protein